MRTIEFRLWDKVHKKMILPDGKHMDKVRIWMNGAISIQEVNASQDTILMQFTGLLDSENQKIFEGDIVTAWFPAMQHNMRAKQEIVFSNGCFGCGDYPLKIMDLKFLKIIGNIHQNPELMY